MHGVWLAYKNDGPEGLIGRETAENCKSAQRGGVIKYRFGEFLWIKFENSLEEADPSQSSDIRLHVGCPSFINFQNSRWVLVGDPNGGRGHKRTRSRSRNAGRMALFVALRTRSKSD